MQHKLVRCDYCGKDHEIKKDMNDLPTAVYVVINRPCNEVFVVAGPKREVYDFCNLDCLRKFFEIRDSADKADTPKKP